jgi:hypothetical protein
MLRIHMLTNLDLEIFHLLSSAISALGLLALVGGGLLGKFLGVRQELRLSGNVLPQNLRNFNALCQN